jgi:hypothetical protein
MLVILAEPYDEMTLTSTYPTLTLLVLVYNLCVSTLERLSESGVHAPTDALLGDLLEVDWSDADIIITSSTEELIEGILERTR